MEASSSNPENSKIVQIVDLDGYKAVLASIKDEGGSEEIKAYAYREVIFNSIAHLAEGKLEINGSQSTYSSLGFMPNR